ncbi:MAG: hypothetical protein HS126_19960 [Anaerolineales bacterium]|nr:hypothetical protein [Anaerolineales bacterium]
MNNEFQRGVTPASLFAPASQTFNYEATLQVADIRRPWKSVNGFSVSAARLAARQRLILHCREDEVLELIGTLNNLLASPEVLDQAFERLHFLERQTRQKVAGLIALKDQPLNEHDLDGLLEDIGAFLARSAEPTTASRLKEAFAPNHPVSEMAGSVRMLWRLQLWLAALKRVKKQGFHVIVYDRFRRPDRPTLEARRNEPILQNGQLTVLPAGFLQPPRYHLTLWAYLVVRSGHSQSRIWN